MVINRRGLQSRHKLLRFSMRRISGPLLQLAYSLAVCGGLRGSLEEPSEVFDVVIVVVDIK